MPDCLGQTLTDRTADGFAACSLDRLGMTAAQIVQRVEGETRGVVHITRDGQVLDRQRRRDKDGTRVQTVRKTRHSKATRGRTKDDSKVDTFVRKVRLDLRDGDAAVLDGQSKILNSGYNRLVETMRNAERRLAELGALLYGWTGTKDDEAEHNRVPEHEALAFCWLDADVRDELRRERYDLLTMLTSKTGLRDCLPGMKSAQPYLRAVHSSPLKNAAMRLSAARADWKSGKLSGGKPAGRPRFRAWKRSWFSIEYDEPTKGWSVENGTQLTLTFGTNEAKERMARTFVLYKPPPGLSSAKAVRIVKEGEDYHAVFIVWRARRDTRQDKGDVVYIDPNSSNLGYLADSKGRLLEIENIPGVKELDRQIDVVKSLRDSCVRKSKKVEFIREDGTTHVHWEPSKRWKRYDGAVECLQKRRRDLIKHALYALANHLFRNYAVVGLGDWVPENESVDMGFGPAADRNANRKLRNTTFHGMMRNIIAWVARRSGRLLAVVEEEGTTRGCHVCGCEVAGGVPPGVKHWTCPHCGTHHGRDENAAINGLTRVGRAVAALSGGNPIDVRPSLAQASLRGVTRFGRTRSWETSPVKTNREIKHRDWEPGGLRDQV